MKEIINLNKLTNPFIDEQFYYTNLKNEFNSKSKSIINNAIIGSTISFIVLLIGFILISLYNSKLDDQMHQWNPFLLLMGIMLIIFSVTALLGIIIFYVEDYDELKTNYDKDSQRHDELFKYNVLNKPYLLKDNLTIKLLWELIDKKQYDRLNYKSESKELIVELSNIDEYSSSYYSKVENDTFDEVISYKLLHNKELSDFYKKFDAQFAYENQSSLADIAEKRHNILSHNGLI